MLARGYAWLTDAAGQPIASTAGVRRRQKIVAQLADGRIVAGVQAVEPQPAAAPRTHAE